MSTPMKGTSQESHLYHPTVRHEVLNLQPQAAKPSYNCRSIHAGTYMPIQLQKQLHISTK